MASQPLSRSSRNRKSARAALLPDELKDALRRGGRMMLGLLLIAMALTIAAALFSYKGNDPSWNTITTANHPVHNWLGNYGAIGADALWQFFGLACFAIPLIIAAWGWGLAVGRELDTLRWRILAAVIALPAASISLALAASVLGSGSRLPSGVIGILFTKAVISDLNAEWVRWFVSVVLGLASLTALYLASALTIEESRWIAAMLHRLIVTISRMAQHVLIYAWQIIRHRRRPHEEEEPEDEEEFEEEAPEKRPLFGFLRNRQADTEEEQDDEADEPPRRIEKQREKAPVIKRAKTPVKQPRLPLASDDDLEMPPLELLQWPEPSRNAQTLSEDVLAKNARMLVSVLSDFGVNGVIAKVSPGPVVTLYELEPSAGTRAARVISLADDIARNMSAVSVRVAVVPGRNVIGIELPNPRREIVYLRELLSTDEYQDTKAALPLVLGKDIAGQPVITDLARMPHLLIAGTTGSGKSVAINTMILSLLYRLPPRKCRFIMIDPKMLELSVYEGIPHLLAPVVTEPKKAIMALRWVVREMEDRYRAMSKLGVRNIEGYNARLREAAKSGETLIRTVQTGFDRETGKPMYEEQPLDLTELPYIVVIVDEMADLMIVAGKEIETAVQRLAQMARAAGIHILMATQRPSVDVITGTIKANFPTRISFQVTSKIDSRTILGEQGAEQLLGQGDMLFMAGGGRITRVHGPFVRDDEVESIVKFLKAQGTPDYLDDVTADDGKNSGSLSEGGGDIFGLGDEGGSGDDLYDKAVDIVLRDRKASTSYIQRQLGLGYNKAAKLVERMEREGLIGPANATGKREIFARERDEG